jgi:hypothetical protein
MPDFRVALDGTLYVSCICNMQVLKVHSAWKQAHRCHMAGLTAPKYMHMITYIYLHHPFIKSLV